MVTCLKGTLKLHGYLFKGHVKARLVLRATGLLVVGLGSLVENVRLLVAGSGSLVEDVRLLAVGFGSLFVGLGLLVVG